MKKSRIVICRIALVAAISGIATGCETGQDAWNNPERELTFRADIEASGQTRVVDTRWDAGDVIGIYMADAADNAAIEQNRRYHTAAGDGVFGAVEAVDRISRPDGKTVALYAYYPHSASATGFEVPVYITDQSDQSRLDVLWASPLRVNSFANPPVFTFRRQMVRLVFNVSAGRGISSLAGLEASVTGVPTRAVLDVRSGEMTVNVTDDSAVPVNAKVTVSGTSAKVELTLLYYAESTPAVTFALLGNTFRWQADRTFERAGRYTYNVTLTDSDGAVVPAVKFFETPTLPTLGDGTSLRYIEAGLPAPRSHMRNYQMLFDTQEHVAQWVAYPMHSTYIGSSGRSDAWGYDPNVPENQQANLSGGWGGTTWDRGHQLPSADRTYSRAENATTFYYTNMTPQYNTMNQGIWANLETRVRTWTNQCDTLYVVTGAVLPPAGERQYVNDRSGRPMAIPQYYYKALAKRTNATNTFITAAWKMDNEAVSGSYNDYRITVSELEQATGLTFFPGLPDPSVKNSVIASQWQ